MLNSQAMNTDAFSLALGILLGSLATGLLLAGYYRHRDARRQMKKLVSEKKKAGDMIGKAKTDRQKGCAALPGAIMLIALGAGVLALALLLLMGGSP